MRIYLLVPEDPVPGPRLGVNLLPYLAEDTAVFLVPELIIQSVIYPGGTDMVHIVGLLLVFPDRAVFRGHGVSPAAHIVHRIVKIISFSHIEERKKFKPGGIVPFALALTAVEPGGIRIPCHLGKHHLHRIRLYAADETEVRGFLCGNVLAGRCGRHEPGRKRHDIISGFHNVIIIR